MRRFLIDANLPLRVQAWQKEAFWFVAEIDEEWSDTEIWEYARKNNHTIVTKDADFSNRIIVAEPPPRLSTSGSAT
jgi:predicted nuclease of predicted toxin-antitoxin system